MAISYIEIDTGQLNKDIGDLGESIKKAEKTLSDMVQEMEELNSMWQGQANLAFQAQFQNDNVLMQELLQEMLKLEECMRYASGEYVKCENEVKDMVDSIRI